MLTARTRFRPLAALALLGVLWLGAACHNWHHLTDHDCDASTAGASQPCATCVAFHGGTIVSDPQTSAIGRPIVVARVTLADRDRPVATRTPSGSPRAPPAA